MSIITPQMHTMESPLNHDKWWVLLTQPKVDVQLGSTKNPKNSNQSKNSPKYQKQVQTNKGARWSDRGEKTRAFIQPLSNLTNQIQYQKIADYKLKHLQISTIINSLWQRNQPEIQHKEPQATLELSPTANLRLLKLQRQLKKLKLHQLQTPQLMPQLPQQHQHQLLLQQRLQLQQKRKKLEQTDLQQRNQEANQKPQEEPLKKEAKKQQPRNQLQNKTRKLLRNDFNFIFQKQNVVILLSQYKQVINLKHSFLCNLLINSFLISHILIKKQLKYLGVYEKCCPFTRR